VVVGVTNEAEGLVKKWIDDNKVKYAIAIVPGKETMAAYDVKGFPSSALVGADGKIDWLGHPANLDSGVLEEALARACVVPPLPPKYASINADLAKKEYGKAHAAIEKALGRGEDEALSKAKEAIEKLLAAKIAGAEEKEKAGDYAGAIAELDEAAKQWKGMPEADEAAKKAKKWRSDSSIRDQIKFGEDFKRAEALEKTGEPAAKKKAYQIYLEISKKAKGTPIGEKAQAAADRLKSS
jgi:hypothetical protein